MKYGHSLDLGGKPMIFGNINVKENWDIYPQAIKSALSFFRDTEGLDTHVPGYFDLDGDRVRLQILDVMTKARDEKRAEVHRCYIDVQLLLKGREHMVYFTDLGNRETDEDCLEESDTLFYKNGTYKDENHIEMQIGSYAVLCPWDAHVPAVQSEEAMVIRKVVLKIRMDMLQKNLKLAF